MTIKERVKRGAKWLDKHQSGWYNRIDLDELDLADDQVCIVGQLTQHNEGYGIVRDFIGHDWTADRGFTAHYGDACGTFYRLTKRWRKEIRKRIDKEDRL